MSNARTAWFVILVIVLAVVVSLLLPGLPGHIVNGLIGGAAVLYIHHRKSTPKDV
jgi:hypothetical protein